MKKLLVLSLVFGFASIATAALSLWVDGAPAESSTIALGVSDTVWIGLFNDGSVGQSVSYISIESGPGAWTGAYNVNSPPAVPYAYAYYYGPIIGIGDTWVFIDVDINPANVNDIGILAEFEFHADGPGDVVISYTDGAFGLMDVLTIHTPEPVSIALLGFGALALRRRK